MDARELLQAGPEGYTAARDTEVRRRRADKDRDGAAALKALGRPSLAFWAVLAAADDAELVTRAVDATTALAEAQAAVATGAPADLTSARGVRRSAVDAVRDRAVARLAEHVDRRRAEGQRDEVRTLVDRVTRHPDLLQAWLDGTLRSVPDETGFDAFAAIAFAPRSEPPADRPARSGRLRPARPDAPAVAASGVPAGVTDDDALARRRRERAAARARAEVADAERALDGAERAAAGTARDLEAAQRALADATAAHEQAVEHRDAAAARLEAARADLRGSEDGQE